MRDEVIALVQRHLTAKLEPSGGGNFKTKCPFHKEGKERKPSFSIHPDKGVFNCFTCKLTGDVEYLLKLLGLPTALIEAEIRNIRPMLQRNREILVLEKKGQFIEKNPFETPTILPDALLGVFDWMPTLLVEKGFTPEVLAQMEVGYDRVNQRITYPIRDLYGNLAGIAGGVTPLTMTHIHQKYRVYQGRSKSEDGRIIPGDFGDWFDDQFPGYKCENHDYLWNFHRVFERLRLTSDPNASVFLVEGYKAGLWMIQAGYWNTVALMGSYISERQKQMLQMLDVSFNIFMDNDDAGDKATIWVGEALFKSARKGVFVIPYPQEDLEDETQPDDYHPEGIAEFISKKKRFDVHQVEVLKSNPQLLEKIQKRRKSKWV